MSSTSKISTHNASFDFWKQLSSGLKNRSRLYGILAVCIVIITFIAYKPVLFNFLFMDDFSFVTWLKEAINDHSLIVQTFFHHYMNEPYYYRPLITVIWAAEYFIWGANGLCFRVCSIICMLLSSLILGLIVFELSKSTTHSSHICKKQIAWAFFSAALFDLYPLHVSAVNWLAAQHAVLVSLFYLLSFWYYLSWRNSSARFFIISSISCFVLALLTEEMAATLPFILFAYETLRISQIPVSINWLTGLKKTFPVTLPYWLILAVYFLLRNLVLGTFIVKSFSLHQQRLIDILQTWLLGLQQVLVPIDVSILAQNSPATIAWEVITISALLLTLYTFIIRNTLSIDRRLALFLIMWFLCSLAPAGNIFGTNPHFHLINARVTYLATVPLCMFLTCGIANFSSDFKYSSLVRTIGGALLVLSTLILYCNNQAYAYIGHRSNNLLEELQKYYQSIPDDPMVKILGLPQPTNALGVNNMPKMPFLKRDISNCNTLDVDDWYIPFGFLKGSINTGEGKINFLYWDEKEQRLKPTIPYRSIPISMNFPIIKYKKAWEGNELKAIIINGATSPGKVEWENGNILHLTSDKQSYLEINLAEFPCWPIDFVSFKIATAAQISNKSKLDYELHFLNNIVPYCSLDQHCSRNAFSSIKIIPNGKEQQLIFPLRNFPDWALGNKCRGLKLLLPSHSNIKLLSISLPDANTIIPTVSGPSITKLNWASNNHFIHYDARRINGCTQVALEIIGPYILPHQYRDFETPYSSQPDPNVAFNIPADAPSGMLKILRASFPTKGTYKARLRALDKNGEQVGLSGDYFLINVE